MPPKAGKRKSSIFFCSDDTSGEDQQHGMPKLRRKCRINYCDEKFTGKYFLKKQLNSSDALAEDLFFYFNVQYERILKTTVDCLETTEDCLEHVLNFVADKDERHTENDFKWKNESMHEIVRKYIRNEEDIAWVYKWDKLDWKTATDEKIVKASNFLDIFGKKIAKPGFFFMQSAFHIHLNEITKEDQYDEQDKNEKSETVKRFFDSVSSLTCPQSYLRNGSCKEYIHFYVRQDQITEESSVFLEDRNIKVIVKPDGVFTNPVYKGIAKWEIVVEIYDPSSDKVLSAQKNKPGNVKILNTSTSSDFKESKEVNTTDEESESLKEHYFLSPNTSDSARPTRRKNVIADPMWRSCVRQYIDLSLPSYCRGHAHIRQKMAGQHVLQLFAQVQRRIEMETVDKNLATSKKSIGMFIINEFIYFSRLDVSPLMCQIIEGRTSHRIPKLLKIEQLEKNPPRVRYSNFRFDITKKNHRLALVLFLRVFLFPETKGYSSDEEYEKVLGEGPTPFVD